MQCTKPFKVELKSIWSEKFLKIHWQTFTMETFLSKLQTHACYFSENISITSVRKFRRLFLQPSRWCWPRRDTCIARSSTDIFLPTIPVSDSLILCCGNLILHQKKEMKMIKRHISGSETTKKCQKNIFVNIKLHLLTWTRYDDL